MKQQTIRTMMLTPPTSVPADVCLTEARAIGDRLCEMAVPHRGMFNWTARALPDNPRMGVGQPMMRSMNYAMFDGAAGVSMFLARLGVVTGDRKYSTTARGGMMCALHLAERQMSMCEDGTDACDSRFGAYSGIMSTIWAAKEVATCLNDAQMREQAQSLLDRLACCVDGPSCEDLMLGYAGAIPCLLDLDQCGFRGAKDLAMKMGEKLMGCMETDSGACSWPRRVPDWYANLTGFSHGAGGIGWALACLHQATGDARCLEAAMGAFEYERRAFMADEGNWPDFRSAPDANGNLHCATYWCHGAPGIGVARALAHPMLGDSRLLEEACVAHETTLRSIETMMQNPGSNVQMCHGLFGNLETLWIMEDCMGIEGAAERARMVAMHVSGLYGKAANAKWGRFTDWPTGMPGTCDIGLMKGLAGVGHFLLRCHAPESVPPVLVPGRSMQC